MERIGTILLGAGLGCFAVAALLTGYLPVSHLARLEYRHLDELVTEPSPEFVDLSRRYPEAFARHFGSPDVQSFRRALLLGRDTYIAEGCWHCHSQYVRPVSNEEQRFGKVSWAAEYRNELFLPHLFGTRRVGPDLIREAGRHGNDWHAAHFFDPNLVAPLSVMPRYPWFFAGGAGAPVPNDRGLALIAYMQWLGSWTTPEVLARAQDAADRARRAAEDE